MFYFKFADN